MIAQNAVFIASAWWWRYADFWNNS